MMAPAALVGTLLMCEGRALVGCVTAHRHMADARRQPQQASYAFIAACEAVTLPLSAFFFDRPINAL